MSALRRIRVNAGLSPDELSERAGVSAEQIRNIESGRARNPRVGTLTKLAQVLDVQPSEIDPMLGSEPKAAA